MRKTINRFVLLVALAVGIAGIVWAHHGSRISYDMTRQVTVKGVVKEWVYQNPHVYFTFEVTDDQGKVTLWAAETDPPIMMERRFQWNRHYLKEGDEVTVTVWPSKTGAPRGFLAKLVTADGRVTDHSDQPRD